MMCTRWILVCSLFAGLACHSAPRAQPAAVDASRPLFNGIDFSGWRSPRGADAAHWSVGDKVLVCESPSQPLWSADDFGDCEIFVDVRAVEGHPIAVFHARGPDAFEFAVEPKPHDPWRRVRARIVGDEIDIDIDGERSLGELPKAKPRGPIGISAEVGGRLEFANIRVRELR